MSYNISDLTELLELSLAELSNLHKLTFGYTFNQPLQNSLSKLSNLCKLTLGHNFDQIINIPFNIKYLKLNCNNQNIIDYLHNNIEELELYSNFNLELNNLPTSIKKIIILNNRYNWELNNLPNSIEYIQLPIFYDKKILNIPSKLKVIKCSKDYKYINDFINYQVIKL